MGANADWAPLPTLFTVSTETNVDADDVLNPRTMLSPNAEPPDPTRRSGEMAALNTYSELLVTVPDWTTGAGSPDDIEISYHRTWLPAPPATVCCVHTAVTPRSGSTASTA